MFHAWFMHPITLWDCVFYLVGLRVPCGCYGVYVAFPYWNSVNHVSQCENTFNCSIFTLQHCGTVCSFQQGYGVHVAVTGYMCFFPTGKDSQKCDTVCTVRKYSQLLEHFHTVVHGSHCVGLCVLSSRVTGSMWLLRGICGSSRLEMTHSQSVTQCEPCVTV